MKHALDLVDNGGIEEKYVLAVTRALGQTMSRLADWEVDIAVDRLLVEGRPIDPVRTRARLESSLPDLEHCSCTPGAATCWLPSNASSTPTRTTCLQCR